MGGVDSAPDISDDFDRAPLAGRSVLVTRTRAQAPALVEPLEALGAEVLCMPVIEVVDPEDLAAVDGYLSNLASYDWIVVTSTNGVDRLLGRLESIGRGTDALAGAKIAAVGSATAAALRRRGLEPDFVPEDYRAEGLVEGFREMGVGAGTRVLIARALEAREVLPEALRAMGVHADVAITYRVVPVPPDPAIVARLREGCIDVAAFASGGTFENFLGAIEAAGLSASEVLGRLAIASIGPVTTAAVRRAGFGVAVEAEESTMPALVGAIARYLEASGR